MTESFTITFAGLSEREQEQAAADLARSITATHNSVEVKRGHDIGLAMDFGATLVVIISSGAAIAVAKGIETWLARWQNASICIEDEHRKVKATGITSADTVRISEIFNISSR